MKKIYDQTPCFRTAALVLFLAVVSMGVHQSSYGMQDHGIGRLGHAGIVVSEKSFFETRPRYHYKEINPKVYALTAQKKRTPAKHVGAVMAMLATFDQAHVLPPESSPQANQLIRSLIQFQSAFRNQEVQAVEQYVSVAFSAQLGQDGATAYELFSANGWTSTSMEALVDYSGLHPFWDKPDIGNALSRYNLSTADWDLVIEIFTKARDYFRKTGQDLHEIFAAQRRMMPGAK